MCVCERERDKECERQREREREIEGEREGERERQWEKERKKERREIPKFYSFHIISWFCSFSPLSSVNSFIVIFIQPVTSASPKNLGNEESEKEENTRDEVENWRSKSKLN